MNFAIRDLMDAGKSSEFLSVALLVAVNVLSISVMLRYQLNLMYDFETAYGYSFKFFKVKLIPSTLWGDSVSF